MYLVEFTTPSGKRLNVADDLGSVVRTFLAIPSPKTIVITEVKNLSDISEDENNEN